MYNSDNKYYTPDASNEPEENQNKTAGEAENSIDDQKYASAQPREAHPARDTTYHLSKQDNNVPFGSYSDVTDGQYSSEPEASKDQGPGRMPHFTVEHLYQDKPAAESVGSRPQYEKDPYSKEPMQYKPNYHYDSGAKSYGSQKRQKTKGMGVKVAAVAIVCSMVFGTAGGYLGTRLYNSLNEDNYGNKDTLVLTQSAPNKEDTGTATKTAAVTGDILTASEIYELATQQVVGITATGTTSYYGQTSESRSMGTGFILSEDGYIATNYHVISFGTNGGSVTVNLKSGESYPAEIVGGYEAGDVALLKIDAKGLPTATLGDSNEITVGEDIYVVGNALGEYDYTLTGGLVSGLDRLLTFADEYNNSQTINMFQIDAAVNSGNSGGPVYNSKGEVIGIVTSKISSSTGLMSSSASVEGLGFAIPINDAISIVTDIQTKGYVEGNVLLSVTVQTVDSTDVEAYGIPSGVYVNDVTQGGAAEIAGIQAKDIITKIDDTELTSVSDLKEALKSYEVGASATLTVYRFGEIKELTVTFTETESTDTSANSQSQEESGNGGNSQQIPDGFGNSGGGFGGFEDFFGY